MKYSIKSLLSLLVSLGFLLSSAQALQQVAEKTLDPTTDIATQKAKDSTVRLVSRVGKSKTLGSGFFVDTDKIATTIHVVAQPGPIFVKLSGKERTLAVKGIAAFDVKNNLVILKLSGEGTPLPLGNSDTVQTDESVSIVGYPYRQYETAAGTIDGIHKSDKWFRMKIAIPRGTSGGPVLNSKGQVIGINAGYGDDTYSYAIPSGALKELLSQSESLELLKEWQKRNHIRAEVHHSQGVAKSAAEDYKNAIVDFDKAIELNPEHVRAYYKRGKAKYHINDSAGVINDWTHAIKLNPEHAKAYNGRGVVKIKLGDSKLDNGDEEKARYLYQEAIDDGTQAITIDPKDADFYINRGAAKFKLGESKFDSRDAKKARHLYQEAIDDGTQAIKIDPDNARAYNNRSLVRCKLGDTESALGDAEKAQKFYHEGIADFDKSIQLKHQESTDASTAHIEKHSIGRASTVRVIGWSGVSSKFSVGSGFFVDTDKIATNIHVVARPGPVFVKLSDKEDILAIKGVTAFDVKNNLVILKLSGESKPLPIGDSDPIHSGEPVSVIGFPNWKYNVTSGTIDSIHKSNKWFWMKVATSQESSGGPVLNNKGQVIGVTVGYGNESHSYAIPSNALSALLTQSAPLEPLTEWKKRELIRAEVWHSQGEIKYFAKDYNSAIVDFNEAIELNPKHVRAYYKRGNAKLNLDDYAGAIDDYTHAIMIDPEDANYYYNRSITRCKLGDIESAQGDAKNAQRLYHKGITDFDKYFQLKHPEDANASTPRIESKKGRASTLHILGWSGVSSSFFVGSGFFVDTDKIATNIHVVRGPGPVFAKLMDKETIWEVVGVIAFDVEYDLVVLKLSGEGTPLPLGDSDIVQKGEPVVTVGYPEGKYKVTAGNVHGIRNSDKFLGITVESAKGNSGGPVLNSNGEVIGITTQSNYYSFAIPSNILKELLTRTVSPEPLTQWRKRNHIRAYVYQSAGQDRYNAGDYAKAIINFDNAIQQNPKYIRAYNWRGRAKFYLAKSKVDQGNVAEAQSLYQAAIDDYTLTIKINPEFALAYHGRGLTQHAFGESKASQGDVAEAQHLYQAAIDDYTHSIKIDPKYTMPYYYRGVTRRVLGKLKADQRDETIAHDLYEAAIQDYTQAIRLRSSYAAAYNERGGVKYLLGKSKANQGNVAEAQQLYKAAIDDFTAAIKIDPKRVFAYKNRGKTKKLLGLHEMAEQDFSKAKELESDR